MDLKTIFVAVLNYKNLSDGQMILQTKAKIVWLVPEVETYPNMIKYTSFFNIINLI